MRAKGVKKRMAAVFQYHFAQQFQPHRHALRSGLVQPLPLLRALHGLGTGVSAGASCTGAPSLSARCSTVMR